MLGLKSLDEQPAFIRAHRRVETHAALFFAELERLVVSRAHGRGATGGAINQENDQEYFSRRDHCYLQLSGNKIKHHPCGDIGHLDVDAMPRLLDDVEPGVGDEAGVGLAVSERNHVILFSP